MRIARTTADELAVEAASEQETERLGRALARVVGPGTVLGLIGPLGAGKTRLVRALAEALGADPDAVSSPTFVLIHEYEATPPVYHFDAYRLATADAFDDLGAADYFAAGGVCVVEWADRVRDRLPANAWFATIAATGPASRRFTFRGRVDLAGRLAHELAAGDGADT